MISLDHQIQQRAIEAGENDLGVTSGFETTTTTIQEVTEEAAAEEQDPLQDNDPWISAQLPESLPTHSNTTDSLSVYGST